MRKKLGIAVSALAFSVAAAVAPAQAADLIYPTGPAGPFIGYTVPVLVVSQGDSVTFLNLDAFQHDVVAFSPGPDTDWCMEKGLKGVFPSWQGGCPMFWTPLIGISQQTPVLGLDNVVPGESYEYFCTIHLPVMTGVLTVLP